MHSYFLCQVEGHWHYSTQQVSHHSGDNEQRRHHHFSHGECFVCNSLTHLIQGFKGEVKQKSLQAHSQIPADKRGNSVLFSINTTAFIKSVCDFLSVFVSAGGYGNGQIRCSPFHGQAQILQTEQDLCRVSFKAISATSWGPLKCRNIQYYLSFVFIHYFFK